MILERETKVFDSFSEGSFTTTNDLLNLLRKRNAFKSELIDLYELDEEMPSTVKIGNSKSLIESLINFDRQCDKYDIDIDMKDIHLSKMLKGEKAIFELFSINNEEIIKTVNSDKLDVESRYSSKMELLDYYEFNKFANYCRDREYYDLIGTIKDYLESKNLNNIDKRSLRLIHRFDDDKFYLRALTSINGYKDFGLNFSVFVALMSLNEFVEESKKKIF